MRLLILVMLINIKSLAVLCSESKSESESESLLDAASRGDEEETNRLIAKNVSIDDRGVDGLLVIHWASIWGWYETVELLINEDESQIDSTTSNGNTPLHLSCLRGHEEVVELLLSRGAEIDIKDKNGEIPLHVAVKGSHLNITKLLLEHESELEAADNFGRTPLRWAVMSNRDPTQIVNILLDKGAEVDSQALDGSTSLHQAASQGREKVVKLLLSRGAKIDIKDKYGQTPLYRAVGSNHESVAKLLLKHENQVNVKDKFLINLLQWVAWLKIGHGGMMEILLTHGAEVDSETPKGDTPLNLAAFSGCEICIEKLLRYNASVDIKNSGGNTPLHTACSRGFENIVKILLENDANPMVVNLNKKKPRHFAEKNGFTGIVNLLRQKNIEQIQAECDDPFFGYIRGGTKAKHVEFPWMAALQYVDTIDNKLKVRCGGTVISKFFILTAAHCVKNTPARITRVRLGSADLEDSNGQYYTVQKSIVHPNYTDEFQNDIALLQLEEEIKFSKNIKPACLEINENDLDEKLHITGWGDTLVDGASTILLKAQVETKPLSECNQLYRRYYKKHHTKSLKNGINKSQYCAFDPEGRSETCQGDSGGPLQAFHGNSTKAHIVGVVSFGIGCGKEFPTVFTRVAHYIDWIAEHVLSNEIDQERKR